MGCVRVVPPYLNYFQAGAQVPAHPGPGRRTLLQVGTGVGNGLRRALATVKALHSNTLIGDHAVWRLVAKTPRTMTVTMSIPH